MELTALSSRDITSCGKVFKKQGIQQRSTLLPSPLNLKINEVNLLFSEGGVCLQSVGSPVKKNTQFLYISNF